MSVEIPLEIWKWRLPRTSSISSRPVGNDFRLPLGNEVSRHFQCPTFPTPYGGPACAAHRRPAQAVGVDAERCDLVSSSVLGSRIAPWQCPTDRDHPLLEWPIFPSGHPSACSRPTRLSG